MTSSTSNSLADKTYYYIRERVGTGHWPPGMWFVNCKPVVQLYALRELLKRFVISIMPRYLADGREFALPHLED